MRGAAKDKAKQTYQQELEGTQSAEDSKRNQQLALLMAKKIRGKDIIFLSAGTDGTDGPTNDAGGIVDGETEDKGFLLGLDIDTFLNNADAGSYLNSTDSLVTTGPTGTNVMDLIIALKN